MTPTACETFPPPTLTFQFSAEPAHPVVGDHVQLSFSVSGRGGIPAYTLSGVTPVFQGDTSTVTSDQLGTVTYQLTAVDAGTATLTLSVNYETSVGCVGQPIFQFVNDTSPPFSIEVTMPTPTPTASTSTPSLSATATSTSTNTPTATSTGTLTLTPTELLITPTPSLSPTPLPCVGDCDGNHHVTGDEILILVNVALGHGSASSCAAEDTNHTTVDRILTALNNALSDCVLQLRQPR